MYRERKIIVPNSKNHSFIEPQQERSKKRFEAILKTAEFIYKNQDDYDLTVQDIAKLSGMKRPSIYKFFPNNESILAAISKKHTDNLLLLIKKNFESLNSKSTTELIKILIDVIVIFLINNSPISKLIFTDYSKKIMKEELLNLFKSFSDHNEIKIKYSLSIIISCLEEAFMREGNISPQQIAETKKACLHYLVN